MEEAVDLKLIIGMNKVMKIVNERARTGQHCHKINVSSQNSEAINDEPFGKICDSC